MDLIERLNNHINRLHEFQKTIRHENDSLRKKLEELEYQNDKLLKNAQDLILKIESSLLLKKEDKS